MIVVSDSGPLTSLKAEQLVLLHNLYGEVLIPETCQRGDA